MRKITVIQLRANDACQAQVDLFRVTFGESASLTKANWSKALAAGLDTLWLARLLPSPARAEYDKVCDAAWAEYDKVYNAARAEYNKVCNAARAEYDKVCDAARAEYDKVCDAARAEYNKVCDAALLAALRKV